MCVCVRACVCVCVCMLRMQACIHMYTMHRTWQVDSDSLESPQSEVVQGLDVLPVLRGETGTMQQQYRPLGRGLGHRLSALDAQILQVKTVL